MNREEHEEMNKLIQNWHVLLLFGGGETVLEEPFRVVDLVLLDLSFRDGWFSPHTNVATGPFPQQACLFMTTNALHLCSH